ncbi:Citrate/oxoglutarate carrier protein 1 [Colletotrichum chlorophyti]|uniref:Citrate/oxoglutarate carrier protein 1 n=1 Tax=Colletotrichum chlorophyti TaxID=708187 RepID=A0A1Q8S6H7_9PEZI|nr:Citrate/oxoglutarate carrier protein 1 [Colletotrichum chlorophyti]
MATRTTYTEAAPILEKRNTQWRNLLVGACMNLIQASAPVTTLGQPMEVINTHASVIFRFRISLGRTAFLTRESQASANRNDTLSEASRKTWARAGFRGFFYQGLKPWAWIEASTRGVILVLTSTEVEYYARRFGFGHSAAGVLGGIVGGASQAYLTMACMKTVQVTRQKATTTTGRTPGPMEVFLQILRTRGIRGVNAVALRQITGWSSRIGISRVAEGRIRSATGKAPAEKLAAGEKICASVFGGALSCWNQPFEVVRVEMQSLKAESSRPESLMMASTSRYIYATSGISGFSRGFVPRFGVAAWATVCMVWFGDIVKEAIGSRRV